MAYGKRRCVGLAPLGEHSQKTRVKRRAPRGIDRVVEGGAGAGFQEMFQNLLRAVVGEQDAVLPEALDRQTGGRHERTDVGRIPGKSNATRFSRTFGSSATNSAKISIGSRGEFSRCTMKPNRPPRVNAPLAAAKNGRSGM